MTVNGCRRFALLLVMMVGFAHADSVTDPNWQNRRWLEKTVRVLRGGEGLLPTEDADALLRLPREEVVAQLMADPRFANMVLDFNMYLLGFKADRVKNGPQFSHEVYGFPNAIESAREVLAGGDYFKVFDLQAKTYVPPLFLYFREPGEENMSVVEVVRARAEKMQSGLKRVVDYGRKDPTATVGEMCNRYLAEVGNGLFKLGLAQEALSAMQSDINYSLDIEAGCFLGIATDVPLMTARLQRMYEIHERLIPAILKLDPQVYSATSVGQLKTIDLPGLGLASPAIAYGVAQRFSLANSSTNFNRKRAAYVLKRFFCDDLTPIAVENPKQHTGGSHGSQTSCYACHYKLDPMAGFFRDHGLQFINFTSRQTLLFDDLAMVDRATYAENWKAAPNSGRAWNVGYVRSVSNEGLNEYGESLRDLHAIMRRAPEVKRCLNRRLFEYMISEDQTVDAGYLDYLTEEFTRRARTNSSAAFKWAVSTLALSHSFTQPDLQTDQCYDHRPGHIPGSSPPCKVAFVFERNCATCHGSVNGAGRLNLKGWITLPDGTQTFPHLDRSGNQLPAHVTFERLNERLTTADERRRMPLGSFMSSQDRQELYLWVQEQMQ